jgi:hypothetical protein
MVYSFISDGLVSTDAWCNVGISEHIINQGCI